ncbi:MAG: PepSY-like domain-containing protein [Verrucomicrobiales bacterium]
MKHLATLSLLFALSPALPAQNEKELPLTELPAEIKAKASALLPGFELQRAQIETESSGAKTYELIGTHEGITTEIDFNEDGSFQEYEKQLTLHQVPFAVRKAIHQAYPGIEFTLFEASFNEHHKVFQYEVEGLIKDRKIDLEVSPSGRTIIESDS